MRILLVEVGRAGGEGGVGERREGGTLKAMDIILILYILHYSRTSDKGHSVLRTQHKKSR